jgi:hypothetical protein
MALAKYILEADVCLLLNRKSEKLAHAKCS